jgi:hypothetical protein
VKYTKSEKQLVKRLKSDTRGILLVLEEYERGEFVATTELMTVLSRGCQFITFSCLSGSAEGEKLGIDLGRLFTGRITGVIKDLLNRTISYCYDKGLTVVLDDCEPVCIWDWSTPQKDITSWYRMVIEDCADQIPENWQVILWSDLKKQVESSPAYGAYESRMREIVSSSCHKEKCMRRTAQELFWHMKTFPNKKLLADRGMEHVALNRLYHCAVQGMAFEIAFPNAILIQTETPWRIKDQLYDFFRTYKLPIIHPYPEERR